MTDLKEKTDDPLLALQARNAKVEADKAWEISCTRRAIIALGTYIIVAAYLTFLGVEGAWLHALVPPGAYILSTLTLPLCKRLWIEKCYKTNRKENSA